MTFSHSPPLVFSGLDMSCIYLMFLVIQCKEKHRGMEETKHIESHVVSHTKGETNENDPISLLLFLVIILEFPDEAVLAILVLSCLGTSTTGPRITTTYQGQRVLSSKPRCRFLAFFIWRGT
jgi:hypothetical protein